MLQLILKDFYVARKNMLPFVFMLVMVQALLPLTMFFKSLDPNATTDDMMTMSLAMAAFPFLAILCVSSESLANEERSIWASFAISSPLGARGQVKSKYYMVFILNSIALVWVVVFDYLFAAIYDDLMAGISTSIGMLTMGASLLLSAIELPLLIRFGIKAGSVYKVILFLVIFIIVGIYLLFGDLSIFGTPEEFSMWLKSLFENEEFIRVLTIFSGIEPMLTLGIYFLSYKLSCKLFCKGVENYER